MHDRLTGLNVRFHALRVTTHSAAHMETTLYVTGHFLSQ